MYRSVAKLAIRDTSGHILCLTRSNHPRFPYEADLPGGTQENSEAMLETMLRELKEEIGYTPSPEVISRVQHIYQGNEYAQHGGQEYNLYVVDLDQRPEITISWEHAEYEWIPEVEFIARARAAVDTFMHMAADALEARAR